MFHGSCGRVSRVLSLAFYPISKSTVHELARKLSLTVKASPEPKIIIDKGLSYRMGSREAWNRYCNP